MRNRMNGPAQPQAEHDSGAPLRPGARLELVDFLRGIAIVEMVSAHFADYFPRVLGRFIDYTETAMALFVLLAGFMVGWQYYRFQSNPGKQTRVLWGRAAKILAIQYIIVLTVCIPLYLLGMRGIDTQEPLVIFTLRSMAFLNQIGLVHILPTFIPLFLVAPLVLFGLRHNLQVLVVLASVGVFLFGHFHPYALDLGQHTIFPFILFQLYFVFGIVFGRLANARDKLTPDRPGALFAASVALLLFSMAIAHGKVIPAGTISFHPLNLYGLLYHASIIFFLYSCSVTFWVKIKKSLVYPYVALFGRHPLFAFVIHLYLAKAIEVLNHLLSVPRVVNYGLVFVSLVAMTGIISAYEKLSPSPRAPIWVRATKALFG